MTVLRFTMAAAVAGVLAGPVLLEGPASARDRRPAAQPGGDFTHTPAAEQKAGTPLPVYFEYSGTDKVARVIVKYRSAQMDDWRRLDLKHFSGGWAGLIPCGDVVLGPMRYWVQGFDEGGDAVASSGDPKDPFVVPIQSEIQGEGPHLPGVRAPRACSQGDSQGAPAEDAPPPAADEEPKKPAKKDRKEAVPGATGAALEDTATKRASMEVAG